MSHNPQAPAFEVNFGHRADAEAEMEVLATYVMHGLAQTETSRFERIFQSMDALKLPAGVDDFSIGRRLEAGESYTPTLRVFAGRGIVADLVEPVAAERPHPSAEPAAPAPLVAPPVSPPAQGSEAAPLFPVQSIFRTLEA